MHYLYRKVFFSFWIQKFQNYAPRTGCWPLHMPFFRTILGTNNFFATCHKHPLFRSFTKVNFQIISFLEIEHPTLWNIYKCNTKFYLRSWILLNKIVCFFLCFSFQRSFFYLLLLKCSDAHLCSLRLIIYWNKNDAL